MKSRPPLAIVFFMMLSLGPVSGQGVPASSDRNSDGIADLWQIRHHLYGEDLDLDQDGDGYTSRREGYFGTDPFNAISVPRTKLRELQGGEFALEWFGVPGLKYRVEESNGLEAPWFQGPEIGPIQNEPAMRQAMVTPDGARKFYRIDALQPGDLDMDGLTDFDEYLLGSRSDLADTDGDNLSDGDERLIHGTGILTADSDDDGLDDDEELLIHSTDPLNPDSDGDGDLDGVEVGAGTNPLAGVTMPVLDPHPAHVASVALTLTGQAGPGDVVKIEGGTSAATATAGPGGAFSVAVTLKENRLNRLFVLGTNAAGQESPRSSTEVIHDAVAPKLVIDFPADGETVYSETATIAGRVGDMLSGELGMAVDVAGGSADVAIGIGINGTFERSGVSLQAGENVLDVMASDTLGNSVMKQITIFRAALPQQRLELVSGGGQFGSIQERLGEPVVVRLVDGGVPVQGAEVNFEVIRSDGRLSPNTLVSGGMSNTAETSADGEAMMFWTLGSDSGCGNNRLKISTEGVAAPLYLCATADPKDAQQINITRGENQIAEAGAYAPIPLGAWVSDSGNGVANIAVVYEIVSGGGQFADGSLTTTTTTGETGHCEVMFKASETAETSIVEAYFGGGSGDPATFVIEARGRTPGAPTTFTGIVLDHVLRPVGGAPVSLEIGGVHLPDVVSGADGRFEFTGVPTGAGHLGVHGLLATHVSGMAIAPGTLPDLHFEVLAIEHAENSLPEPIRLPALKNENARTYTGEEDVELTVAGLEGFRMVVKAGSVTLPDGRVPTAGNPATLSLNEVQIEDIPMPMPDGNSPAFAWTLQPGGTRFDPPVEIHYPNIDALPAGSDTNFVSFNHDTSRFEIVAAGKVTSDGSELVTLPGEGISEAGWGGSRQPPQVSTSVGNCKVRIFGADGAFGCLGRGGRFEARSESGNIRPSEISWEVVEGNDVVSINGGSQGRVSIRLDYLKAGRATLKVTRTCRSGGEATDFYPIDVFDAPDTELSRESDVQAFILPEVDLLLFKLPRIQMNYSYQITRKEVCCGARPSGCEAEVFGNFDVATTIGDGGLPLPGAGLAKKFEQQVCKRLARKFKGTIHEGKPIDCKLEFALSWSEASASGNVQVKYSDCTGKSDWTGTDATITFTDLSVTASASVTVGGETFGVNDLGVSTTLSMRVQGGPGGLFFSASVQPVTFMVTINIFDEDIPFEVPLTGSFTSRKYHVGSPSINFCN